MAPHHPPRHGLAVRSPSAARGAPPPLARAGASATVVGARHVYVVGGKAG